MPHQIAVLLGSEGKTTSFAELGKVVIYTRKSGKWVVAKEKEFSLIEVKGMSDLRKKMEQLLDHLAECKIFVGSEMKGIPVNMLEQANCRIWEWSGSPAEFLDEIRLREETCAHSPVGDAETSASGSEQADRMGKSVNFLEKSPGNFTISVKEIQENNAQITTKQALFPFLKQKKFETLEIICNHVPQWLETEVLRGGLSMEILEEEGQTRVLLQIISG